VQLDFIVFTHLPPETKTDVEAIRAINLQPAAIEQR
jgi:hypothetical protein